MAGYHFLGERPFSTVYLNGVVRDPQHRAFSKSLGNGIDPLDAVERYGADALRYTVVAGAAAGTDVIMDRDEMDGTFAAGRHFANKLWNMGRLLLSAVGDEAPDPGSLDAAQFELADRWILSRCQRVVSEATDALERHRLNDAASVVYHFVWDELADWYLEQIKPRLYGATAGGDVASAIVVHVFQTALRLLHPIVPFLSEELWQHLPGEREPLLAAATWPTPQQAFIDGEAEGQFARVRALVTAVRTVRAEYGVPPGAEVRAFARPANAEALQAFNAEQRTIERLAKLSRLSLEEHPAEVGAHQVLPDGSSVFVPLGDAIDVQQECARLAGELERMDTQLAGVAAKLSNQQFITRAPADVVERERDKERSWREQRETLAGKLRALGC
jgi:valyl-tRNA synthetase